MPLTMTRPLAAPIELDRAFEALAELARESSRHGVEALTLGRERA